MRAAPLLLSLLASAAPAGELRFAPEGDSVWDFRAHVGWGLDSRTRRGAMEWKISGELHCLGDGPDGRIRLALVARAPEGCEVPSGVAIYLHDPATGLSERLLGEGAADFSPAVNALLRLDPLPAAGRPLLAAPGAAEVTRKRTLFGLPRDFKARLESSGPDGEGRVTLTVRQVEPVRELFRDPGEALLESESFYLLDPAKGEVVRRECREVWLEPDGGQRTRTVSVEIRNRRARGPNEAAALADLSLLFRATSCLPHVASSALFELRPFAEGRPANHPWGGVAAALVDEALPGLLPPRDRDLVGLVADEARTDLAGTVFDPEELEGGVTLLAFWAPGAPGAAEMATALGLRGREIRALGVRVVVFHCGDAGAEEVRRLAATDLAGERVVLGGSGILSLLEVEALPAFLWVDRRGWIAHRRYGSPFGIEHEWFWLARRLLAEKEGS